MPKPGRIGDPHNYPRGEQPNHAFRDLMLIAVGLSIAIPVGAAILGWLF